MDTTIAEVLGNRSLGDVFHVEPHVRVLWQLEAPIVGAEVEHAVGAQQRAAALDQECGVALHRERLAHALAVGERWWFPVVLGVLPSVSVTSLSLVCGCSRCVSFGLVHIHTAVVSEHPILGQ